MDLECVQRLCESSLVSQGTDIPVYRKDSEIIWEHFWEYRWKKWIFLIKFLWLMIVPSFASRNFLKGLWVFYIYKKKVFSHIPYVSTRTFGDDNNVQNQFERCNMIRYYCRSFPGMSGGGILFDQSVVGKCFLNEFCILTIHEEFTQLEMHMSQMNAGMGWHLQASYWHGWKTFTPSGKNLNLGNNNR